MTPRVEAVGTLFESRARLASDVNSDIRVQNSQVTVAQHSEIPTSARSGTVRTNISPAGHCRVGGHVGEPNLGHTLPKQTSTEKVRALENIVVFVQASVDPSEALRLASEVGAQILQAKQGERCSLLECQNGNGVAAWQKKIAEKGWQAHVQPRKESIANTRGNATRALKMPDSDVSESERKSSPFGTGGSAITSSKANGFLFAVGSSTADKKPKTTKPVPKAEVPIGKQEEEQEWQDVDEEGYYEEPVRQHHTHEHWHYGGGNVDDVDGCGSEQWPWQGDDEWQSRSWLSRE